MKAVDDLPYDVCKALAFRYLVKLANVADQHGRSAYRFVPEVANELGVHERSVFRAIKELEDGGLIERSSDQSAVSKWRGGNRPIVFNINMRPFAATAPLDDDEAYQVDLAARQCPHNGGKAHRFDSTYGYCSCGASRADLVGT